MPISTKDEPKIRKYYQPTDKEKELLSMVYDRKRVMTDNPQRQDAEKEWDAGEKAWDQMAKEDEELEDWQADYYVPLTTGIIESMIAEMIDQSPQPIILPRSTEDKPKATVMKHTFEYTWDVADGDDELENVLKDALIYGNGFAQEYYWKDRRMIQKMTTTKGMKKGGLSNYEEFEVFDYDDCYMENVSPYELFFDPTARTINRGPYKARDAIRRYIMKLDDFKTFFSGDVWDPLNNARLVRPGGDTNWYAYYQPPQDVDKSKEVEVLWYWSRSPKDWLIIVANDVLIKAGPNPYKHKQLPFAMTIDIKRPHKFYHKGEPKLLSSIQEELNTIRRMITDRNHLDIDKMWLVSRNESFSEDDAISRPHGFIRVDDPANYKPIEYGDIPKSVQLTLDELNKDAVRVTGAEERFQAVKTPGTATEAAILAEGVKRRIKAKLKRLEEGFLVDIGRMRVANILQFYSQPKLEKIVGEAGSEEYTKMLADVKRRGLLENIDGQDFKKEYRQIRVKGKELIPNETGEIIEQPAQGITFFNLKPEYFMPVARGGYDIKFEAGSTMPVSKPLQIKQVQDLVAMLMPLATAGVGYDPVKLGDWLIRIQDFDPEDVKIENAEKDVSMAREEMLINLASQENEQISNGQPVPELGTPFATAAHTKIHIAFMRSQVAKSMPEETYKLLVKHAMGEITAQSMRGDVAGQMGQGNNQMQSQTSNGQNPPQTVVSSSQPYNEELKAVQPAKVQGGEEVSGGTKGSMMNRVFSLMGKKR